MTEKIGANIIGAVLAAAGIAGTIVTLKNDWNLLALLAIAFVAGGAALLVVPWFLADEPVRDPEATKDQNLLTIGMVFAFVVPFIGLVIGLVLLFRRPSYGVQVIVGAIIAGLLWFAVLQGLS